MFVAIKLRMAYNEVDAVNAETAAQTTLKVSWSS